MRILVTGDAGFIGFHTSRRLLDAGHEIHGFDNFNDYYDPVYKEQRATILREFDNYTPYKGNLEDASALAEVMSKFEPEVVLHLAAQAGVRYSLENPRAYIDANIIGFQNMIDLIRECRPRNFVYASSSSVYGAVTEYPFRETQKIDQPVSLYAATKASNEMVAHAYSHLFEIPTTGLRFFTVYGPNSRPDMAMFKFARLMKLNQPIPVFNGGKMIRDFTYVDDIVSGIISTFDKPQLGAVYNLGRGEPMELMEMISLLEQNLGIIAQKEMLPMQLGDVPKTISDISKARAELGYDPKISLSQGAEKFSAWFQELAASSEFK